MTDDTVTSVDTNDDNQEAFEAEFYSTATTTVEEAPKDEPEDAEDVDDLGEDEDRPTEGEDEDEDQEDSDEDSEEESDEEDEKPEKRNRISASERIKQINAKMREQEREFTRRIQELEAAVKEKAKEEEVPLREQLPEQAPSPDALDDKGEPLYPLGEFDPAYIRDLTKFTIEREQKAANERRAEEERAREIQQAQEQLKNEWTSKLDAFEEQEPDVRENIRELTDAFSTLDPGYGEYLAVTLMSMDNGPQIMNYLSQNIGEAQKIVNLGPAGATLAIGRLDAILSPGNKSERKEKKLSKAPPPPESHTRGSKGKFAVRPDTDNQDAFEKEFFKDY